MKNLLFSIFVAAGQTNTLFDRDSKHSIDMNRIKKKTAKQNKEEKN